MNALLRFPRTTPVSRIHAINPITEHHIAAITTRKSVSPRYSRNTANNTAAIANPASPAPRLTPALYPPTCSIRIAVCPPSEGKIYVAYWLNPMLPDAADNGADKVS